MRAVQWRGVLFAFLLISTLLPLGAAAQSGTTHTVQAGDTLQSIARAYGVTVAALLEANHLDDPDMLRYGQVLNIPVGLTPTPQVTPTPVLETYTVQAGDSLAQIARRAGVSPAALLAANGLDNADLIWPGQVLIIPAAPSPNRQEAREPAPTPQPEFYVVQAGESLRDIAQKLGVTTSELIEANGIVDPDLLRAGQRLRVPGQNDTPATPTPSVLGTIPATSTLPGTVTATLTSTATLSSQTSGKDASGTPMPPPQLRYTVQEGDTLAKIAKRFGTTAAAIARINKISSMDVIAVGADLIIPRHYTGPTIWPGKATRFVTDISEQRCWLYQADVIIGDWPCSTGRKGYETRPGTYRIQSREEEAFGSSWNLWMPYWLGIYWAGRSENGIHGMPWDAKTDEVTWEGQVGNPITYGCIMLSDRDAKTLFDLSYIGMPVIVRP